MTRARKERGALRSETGQLLKDLGSTADTVAGNLETAGVKGVPGSGTGCAVARYLNAVMASDPRLGPISVNNEAVTIFGRHWWTPPVVVPVPPPCAGSSSASTVRNSAPWPSRRRTRAPACEPVQTETSPNSGVA